MSPASAGSAFTVLLVCTGNICRSALAERLGRAYLDDRLGERASDVQLVSAGTHAVVGSAMHPDSALVLRGYGAEPGGFRARQLDEVIAGGADLVLTMTRAHRAALLERAPRALQRSFTLREAAALLSAVTEHPQGPDLPGSARALVAAMARARGRRSSGEDDDIRDPIGMPVEVHEEVGELIAATLLVVLDRLAALAEDHQNTASAVDAATWSGEALRVVR
ncbi:arsenate reductase/protein-tyrosine-phosphatase family protein [Blastococcus sp. SYSU DS1021]